MLYMCTENVRLLKVKISEKYDKSTSPRILSILDDKNLRAGTNRFDSVIILVIEENMKIYFSNYLPFLLFWTKKLDSAVFVFF